MTSTRATSYLVCAGAALLLSVAIGHAQINGHDHSAAAPPAHVMPHGHAAMMADMQAAQRRLDDLVSQMNAATGAEKIDRIAAVVTEMAAMHKQMSSMTMMQGGMMPMMQKPPDAAATRP